MFITVELVWESPDKRFTVYVPKDGAVYIPEIGAIIRMGKANEPGASDEDTRRTRC